jgi:DNA-binding MarR family transcriptional regulator
MNNHEKELSFDAVIPSALLMNEKVEPNCIRLYAFIRNLSNMTGYCFATNGYLSKLMKYDESSIKRWIVSLEKEGYLEVETNKDGIYWQRRIYLSDKFKESLRRLKNELPPAQNRATPSSKMSYIKEEYLKEDKKKEEKESLLTKTKEKSASPPPSEKSFYEGRYEEKIHITEKEHKQLCDQFGKDLVEEYVERLYDWSKTDPLKFSKKKCHNIVIKTWINRDLKKTKSVDYDKGLNASQLKNWKLNQEVISELQQQLPRKMEGIFWFYKARALSGKGNGLNGLMPHIDFCRQLEKILNQGDIVSERRKDGKL